MQCMISKSNVKYMLFLFLLGKNKLCSMQQCLCIIKQLLDLLFAISRVFKVSVISFKSYRQMSKNVKMCGPVHQQSSQNFKVIITQKISSQKIGFTISYIKWAYKHL